MPIIEEIRLHSANGDCTVIGPNAIILSLNPSFHPPIDGRFHIYSRTGELIDTKTDYAEGSETTQSHNAILIWRDDLTSPSAN